MNNGKTGKMLTEKASEKGKVLREFIDGYKVLVSYKEEYPYGYTWWSVFKYGHLCADGRIFKGELETGLKIATAMIKELVKLEE